MPGLNWVLEYRRSDVGRDRLASVSVANGVSENSGASIEPALVTKSSLQYAGEPCTRGDCSWNA